MMSSYGDRDGDGGRSDWADLAHELLELVFQRLTLIDYRNCREICRSWRKAVDHALSSKERCPPAPQLPFLLSKSCDNPPQLVSLLAPHKVLTIPTQIWAGIMHYSVHGWVLFRRTCSPQEHHTCFKLSFFNPVSGASFNLPKLVFPETGKDFCLCFRMAFDSAPDSPNFLAAVYIFYFNGPPRLSFCRGSSKSWTLIETLETKRIVLFDIAFHDGQLYAATLDYYFKIVVLRFSFGTHPNYERIVILDPIPMPFLEALSGIGVGDPVIRYKLAFDTNNGELFLVFRFADRIVKAKRDDVSFPTREFRVLKLDLSTGRCCEVNHLGDRLLFWNDDGRFWSDHVTVSVISTRGLIDSAHELFNGGNRIIFSAPKEFVDHQCSNYDLGVFFMVDKSIKRFGVHSSLLDSIEAIWFNPSL